MVHFKTNKKISLKSVKVKMDPLLYKQYRKNAPCLHFRTGLEQLKRSKASVFVSDPVYIGFMKNCLSLAQVSVPETADTCLIH